ncbi:MAG TPA: carboxypeptidase M32 [Acidobacteriota bacterium]|nr:carboxypeptidase M32 [Acidobacteriota bacterium]HQF88714.1 carboxypeptidase M32 [Acidobacteriota bacterium]HQG91490.1 carboxypeptidase M32 [Acidobacteriota bacterium]HQK87989.1 carboxypeptidase M32 [Acidobacteriota bacterium]
MTRTAYAEFLDRIREIHDLHQIDGWLQWDQQVTMPAGGSGDRAAQMATLSGLIHERFTDPRLGELLDCLADAPGLDAAQSANVRETRRDRDRAVRVPPALVQAFAKAKAQAFDVWQAARPADDFRSFAPHLDELVRMAREMAAHIGYADEPYDALLDEYEPGMTAAAVQAVFEPLGIELRGIIDRLDGTPRPRTDFLERTYDPARQQAFCRALIADLGYDLERGRLDESSHPFTIGNADDVRITVRYNPRYLPAALFAAIHETGHALYEQGVDPAHRRTPMGNAVSLGIHESQSRLWENMIGRSPEFWGHYFPRLQALFPDELTDVSAEEFVRAVNVVRPSLVRVEADEVTYSLHVLLRFEIERALVNGAVGTGELPELWRERMRHYLGLAPETDRDGVLQDIHWSIGSFGYFPTYAMGNLYAAQLRDAMLREIPDLMAQVGRGRFQAPLAWLRERVHRQGRLHPAPELIRRATGAPPDAAHFIRYIREKYGALYGRTL